MKTRTSGFDSCQYVTILEFHPDDPSINDAAMLEVLFNRAAEQLETKKFHLFWLIDHCGFRSLKIKRSNIGIDMKLSKLEVEKRLSTMHGFFWGITYPKHKMNG